MMKENNPDENSKNSIKKQVAELYELMKAENLEELEINDKDFHVHLKRKSKRPAAVPVRSVSPEAAPRQEAEPVIEGKTLKSPITGVFYRAASPSSPPFAKEGETAETGKTLCIVEAMKVMNEIKAEGRTKILRILIENGKSVTAGQDLFLIEKL
jgi:acetyl-CoA carboxylase biotin carboxyl carrier protein